MIRKYFLTLARYSGALLLTSLTPFSAVHAASVAQVMTRPEPFTAVATHETQTANTPPTTHLTSFRPSQTTAAPPKKIIKKVSPQDKIRFKPSKLATQSLFDEDAAYHEYEHIKTTFKGKNRRLQDLSRGIARLEVLHERAATCEGKALARQETVEKLLSSLTANHLTASMRADRTYLKRMNQFYTEQLSACRLFAYRSKEALLNFKRTLNKLSTERLFRRIPALWDNLDNLTTLSKLTLNKHDLYEASGLAYLHLPSLIVIGALVLFAFAIATIIRIICHRWIRRQEEAPDGVIAIISVIGKYSHLVLISSVLTACFFAIFSDLIVAPSLKLVMLSLTLYALLLSMARYVLAPPHGKSPIKSLHYAYGLALYRRIRILGLYLLIGFIVDVLARSQSFPIPLVYSLHALYSIGLAFLITWLCWLFTRLPLLKGPNNVLRPFVKMTLILFFVCMVTLEGFGFARLINYLLSNTLYSLALGGLCVWIWQLRDTLYQVINDKRLASARQFKRFIGAKPEKTIYATESLNLATQVGVWLFFIMGQLIIWTPSASSKADLLKFSLIGVTYGSAQFSPLRAVLSLVVFSVVSILGKALAATIARRAHTNHSLPQAQVASATIMHQVSLALAVIIALLVFGLNLSQLTVVAGALSFGIGFGLREIVGQYLSGLLLLTEKPFKPGDYVRIGDTEGRVVKVRSRATQIATPTNENVFIPNTKLISSSLQSNRGNDDAAKFFLPVGVAKGTDLDFAKKILLDIAHEQGNLSQEEPNAPYVLLHSFTDHGAVFHIHCSLKNIDVKPQTISRMNFAILKGFAENNIEHASV